MTPDTGHRGKTCPQAHPDRSHADWQVAEYHKATDPLSKPAGTVSEEISHLVRDKGYSQERAVAAALNMQRAGKIARKASVADPLTLVRGDLLPGSHEFIDPVRDEPPREASEAVAKANSHNGAHMIDTLAIVRDHTAELGTQLVKAEAAAPARQEVDSLDLVRAGPGPHSHNVRIGSVTYRQAAHVDPFVSAGPSGLQPLLPPTSRRVGEAERRDPSRIGTEGRLVRPDSGLLTGE